MIDAKALALAVPADGAALVKPRAERNAAVLAALEVFELASDDDLAFAGEALRSVVDDWKRLEVERTAVTKPLYEAARRVSDWFKPAQDPLKKAETMLRAKVAAYVVSSRAAAVAAQPAVAAGELPTSALAPPPALEGVSVKEVWDFEVAAPDLVPRAWLRVDEDKLAKACKLADTNKAPPPVPGVRFFRRGAVRVGAK